MSRRELIHLFHKAWGHCKASHEYDKEIWRQLDVAINEVILAAAANVETSVSQDIARKTAEAQGWKTTAHRALDHLREIGNILREQDLIGDPVAGVRMLAQRRDEYRAMVAQVLREGGVHNDDPIIGIRQLIKNHEETERDAMKALIPLLEGHPDRFGVDDLGPFYVNRSENDHQNYNGRYDACLDDVVGAIVQRYGDVLGQRDALLGALQELSTQIQYPAFTKTDARDRIFEALRTGNLHKSPISDLLARATRAERLSEEAEGRCSLLVDLRNDAVDAFSEAGIELEDIGDLAAGVRTLAAQRDEARASIGVSAQTVRALNAEGHTLHLQPKADPSRWLDQDVVRLCTTCGYHDPECECEPGSPWRAVHASVRVAKATGPDETSSNDGVRWSPGCLCLNTGRRDGLLQRSRECVVHGLASGKPASHYDMPIRPAWVPVTRTINGLTGDALIDAQERTIARLTAELNELRVDQPKKLDRACGDYKRAGILSGEWCSTCGLEHRQHAPPVPVDGPIQTSPIPEIAQASAQQTTTADDAAFERGVRITVPNCPHGHKHGCEICEKPGPNLCPLHGYRTLIACRFCNPSDASIPYPLCPICWGTTDPGTGFDLQWTPRGMAHVVCGTQDPSTT